MLLAHAERVGLAEVLAEDLELADRDRGAVGFVCVREVEREEVTLRVRLGEAVTVLRKLLLLVLVTVAEALRDAKAWTPAEKPRTPAMRSWRGAADARKR